MMIKKNSLISFVLRRWVTSAMFFIALSTPLVLIPSHTAHAQLSCAGTAIAGAALGSLAVAAPSGLPVTDKANTIINTKLAADSTVQNVVTCALNGLAWTVAKTAVQSITKSTVNWINSGFNGSPAFVSDLNSNLKYLGDAVAENFFTNFNKTFTDTTGFNLKSPFQDQINQQLRDEYYKSTGSFGLNYTLNKTSTDPRAFINEGKFAQGGFDAFFSASQNQANNPFGEYTLASNALWSAIDAAGKQRQAELQWGKGFLPWRGSCPKNAAANNAASLSNTEQCPFSSVRTPGSVIENQLENTLGSGVRELDLADSINEVVGALMGQLVNQVLGPSGLSGTSQPSSGGGSSYINDATNPSQYNAVNVSIANGIIQNLYDEQLGLISYRSSWQKVLDAANTAKQSCTSDNVSSIALEAQTEVDRASNVLQALFSVQDEIQAAIDSTSANKSVEINTALADYQSFLSSSNIPNSTESANAAFESSDTSGTTGTQSLYSEAIAAQKSCQ